MVDNHPVVGTPVGGRLAVEGILAVGHIQAVRGRPAVGRTQLVMGRPAVVAGGTLRPDMAVQYL